MSAPNHHPPAPGTSHDQAEEYDLATAALAPVYAAVGRALAWGLRLSGALLAAGLLLTAFRGDSLSNRAEPLPEALKLVADGRGAGLVDLAIIAMVLTPVATVLVLAVGFFRLGDRRFGMISLVVLAILGISVSISLLR
jgi:hypothetical protein